MQWPVCTTECTVILSDSLSLAFECYYFYCFQDLPDDNVDSDYEHYDYDDDIEV